MEVLRLGHTVVKNLAEITPPKPKIPKYQMDPEIWRGPMSDLVDNLEGLTGRVAAEHAAIDAYDQAFFATANLVSTLLDIAGQKELAKRVRPSTRRPGQTAEEAPAEGKTSAE